MFHQLLFSLLNEKNARRAAHVINPQLQFLFLSLFNFCRQPKLLLAELQRFSVQVKSELIPVRFSTRGAVTDGNFGETNAWLKLQSKPIRANATH